MNDILAPERNKLTQLRNQDEIIGALVNDITNAALVGDYKTVASAAAWLLVKSAVKAGVKPFSLLRFVYKYN